MDFLGNSGLVIALEIVFYHVVCSHVDTDLIGTNWTLEGSPSIKKRKILNVQYTKISVGINEYD